MTELSPAARRLLNSAAEHDGPTPQNRKNLERKIALAASATAVTLAGQAAAKAGSNSVSSLASGHAAATSAAVTASSAKGLAIVATTKTLSGAAPWLIAAGVSTAIATPLVVQSGVWQAPESPAPHTSTSTAPSSPLSAQASVVASQRNGPTPASTTANATSSAARQKATATSATLDAVAPRAVNLAQYSPKGTTVAKPSVGTELALLGKARAALRAGDGSRALTLLDEHARTFVGGQLSAERQAVRILALCSLGRTSDARAVANQFFHQHPHSPLTQRVASSCAIQRNLDAPVKDPVPRGNE
jgi:hypothetical protein